MKQKQGSALRLTGCQYDQKGALASKLSELVASWWLVFCPVTKENQDFCF